MNITRFIPAPLRNAIANPKIEYRAAVLNCELKQVRTQLRQFQEKLAEIKDVHDRELAIRDEYLTEIEDARDTQLRETEELKGLRAEYDWVQDELERKNAMCNKLQVKADLLETFVQGSIAEVRGHWLSYHISRINTDDYGDGQYYEIFEHRHQLAIRCFLAKHGSGLTSEEVRRVKSECDYIEKPQINIEKCQRDDGSVVEIDVSANVRKEMI